VFCISQRDAPAKNKETEEALRAFPLRISLRILDYVRVARTLKRGCKESRTNNLHVSVDSEFHTTA